jgi:hypothetical protein
VFDRLFAESVLQSSRITSTRLDLVVAQERLARHPQPLVRVELDVQAHCQRGLAVSSTPHHGYRDSSESVGDASSTDCAHVITAATRSRRTGSKSVTNHGLRGLPAEVQRRRMYQRDGARQVLVERVNCFGEVSVWCGWRDSAVGRIGRRGWSAGSRASSRAAERASGPRTFFGAAGHLRGALAGVVEIHGKQCEQAWIAELGFGHPEPVEEFDAAGVVPGDAALLGFVTRVLGRLQRFSRVVQPCRAAGSRGLPPTRSPDRR